MYYVCYAREFSEERNYRMVNVQKKKKKKKTVFVTEATDVRLDLDGRVPNR